MDQLMLQQLVSILEALISHDGNTRNAAEQALRNTMGHVGACAALANIATCQTQGIPVSESVQQLAAVHLKNVCSKRWRLRSTASASSAPQSSPTGQHTSIASNQSYGGLSKEEKQYVRGVLVSNVCNAQLDVVASQLSLCISIISRYDYPTQWPTLIHDITQAVESSDVISTMRLRALLILHHVLKVQGTRRLSADKQRFQQLCSDLQQPMWQLYAKHSEVCQQTLTNLTSVPQEQAVSVLQPYILCIKILKTLYLHQPPIVPLPNTAAHTLQQNVPRLLSDARDFSSAMSSLCHTPGADEDSHLSSPMASAVLKTQRSLAQFLRIIAQQHPHVFVVQVEYLQQLLGICTHVVCANLPPAAMASSAVERGVVETFKTLNTVLCQPHFTRQPTRNDGANNTHVDANVSVQHYQQCITCLQSWFSEQRYSLIESILLRHFMMTQDELTEWQLNPESCYQRLLSSNDEVDIRPCAEHVLESLLEHFHEQITHLLLTLLKEHCHVVTRGTVPGGSSQADEQSVVLRTDEQSQCIRECMYGACCVAFEAIGQYIDVGAWYRSVLRKDLTSSHPIIQRRILLLVSKYLPDFQHEYLQDIYAFLAYFLKPPSQHQPPQPAAQPAQQSDIDPVVAHTAAHVLCHVITDMSFDDALFSNYARDCLRGTLSLAIHSSELDNQLNAFECVKHIIQVIDFSGVSSDAINSHDDVRAIDQVVHVIGQVWQQSNESLLKSQLLRISAHIVIQYDTSSCTTYPTLLPVLQQALAPASDSTNSTADIVCLEDAISLLLVIVRAADSRQLHLLDFYPSLGREMVRSTEYLPDILMGTEGMALLGWDQEGADGTVLLTQHGVAMGEAIKQVLPSVNADTQTHIYTHIDTMILLSGSSHQQAYVPILQATQALLHPNTPPERLYVRIVVFVCRCISKYGCSFVLQTLEGQGSSPISSPFITNLTQQLDSLPHTYARAIVLQALLITLHSTPDGAGDAWSGEIIAGVLGLCNMVLEEVAGESGQRSSQIIKPTTVADGVWVCDAVQQTSLDCTAYVHRTDKLRASDDITYIPAAIIQQYLAQCVAKQQWLVQHLQAWATMQPISALTRVLQIINTQ